MYRHTLRDMSLRERTLLERHASPGWLSRIGQRLLSRLGSNYPGPTDFATDLDNGIIEEHKIQTISFVQAEEWNDEGPIYFFQLPAAKILLLAGQWLFDSSVVDERLFGVIETYEGLKWPRIWTVVRAPQSGFVFAVTQETDELVERCRVVEWGNLPALGMSLVFEGSLDSVEADCKTAYGRLRHPWAGVGPGI
ncbi:MAG: hypothetical protein FJ387_30815 [Verrucomicrobia bacterium]|nr:hypothetical protein [Verrucomicrobiota bacterium]